MKKKEVSIVALKQNPSGTYSYTMILEDLSEGKKFFMTIGNAEAESIALGIENIPIVRPLTHDLFKNLMDQLGMPLKEVFIYKMDEEHLIFYAYLYIENDKNLIELDCRPSDGIALAVRFGVPIYCSESVIEKASQYLKKQSSPQEPDSTPLRLLSIEELNVKLNEAVEKENYEEAIKLRDEINARTQNLP